MMVNDDGEKSPTEQSPEIILKNLNNDKLYEKDKA